MSWSPSASLSDTTTANPTATPSTTTSYVVQGTSGNNCTATDFITVTVSTVPTITVSASADTICRGDSTQLTATGGAIYSWSGGPASTPNSASTFVNPTVDTRYKVEVTTLSGCFDSAFVDVFIDPIITINVVEDDTVCLGDTITLSAAVANGVAYQWTTGAGEIFTPDSLTTKAVPFISENYVLTVTNVIGCTNSDTVAIFTQTSPGLTIAPPLSDSLCLGDSTLLIASGAPNISWFQNGFVVSPNNDSTYVKPTSPTTFIARGSSTIGCDALDSIRIFVDQIPSVAITNDTSICEDDSLVIVVSGGTSYSWSPIYQGVQLSTDSILVSPDVDTVYTVTVSNSTGCTITASTRVTVNQKPSVTISGDTTTCLGKSIQLIANAPAATSFAWREVTNLPVIGTNDTLSITPSASLSYFVEVAAANGCLDRDTASITITSLQNTGISNDTSICVGDSVILSAFGGDNYAWSPSTFLNDSTAQNPIAKPDSSITYNVTISTNDGCSAVQTVTINTNVIPTGTLVLSQDTSCFGTSFTATASLAAPSQANASGTYSFDNGATFSNTNQLNVTQSAAGDTTIRLILKDDIGCTSVIPINETHTMLTALTMKIDTIVVPSCTPPPGEFRAYDFTGGIAPYKFSLNGDTAIQTSDTTISNVLPGSYIVSIEDAYGCRFDNNINFISSITFDTTVVHPVCFGDNTGSITFSNIQGGLTPYQLSFGDTLDFGSDTVFNNLSSGIKTIFLKDASGCLLQTNISINGSPEISPQITAQQNITCFGDNNGEITFNIVGGTAPFRSILSGNLQIGNGPFTYTNLPAAKDTLFVIDDRSCLDSIIFEITQPLPIETSASVVSSPTGCNSDDGEIRITSTTGGSGFYEFSIDSATTFTDSVTVATNLVNIPSGVYTIITQDSLHGCLDTTTVFLNASNGLLLDSINNNSQNPNCQNLNGSIALANLKGAPRPYELKLVDNSDNSIVEDYQSDSAFAPLVAGNYTVVIKDAVSCEYFYDVPLAKYTPITINLTTVEASCGQDNGQVLVDAANGSGNYQYSLQELDLSSPEVVQPDSAFKELADNTYLINVLDTEDPTCSSTDTAIVTTSSIGLVLKTDTTSCFGAADARITILDIINANNSLYLFEFSVDDTLGFTTDTIFNNLTGGAHTVFIKQIDRLTGEVCVYEDIDETASTARVSANGGKSVEVPEREELTANITTLPSDYGKATGSIFLHEIRGGSKPYAFSINDKEDFVALANLDGVSEESRGYAEGLHTIFIKDKNGCLLELEAEIGRTLYIPNIFTPNGDGKNDFFYISNLPESGAKLRIYDRWGILSYKSFYYQNDWDGKNQPDGLYYYELDTPTQLYKGWVQIVRK